ncbi:hypothetical protein [Methanogenium cariaci]
MAHTPCKKHPDVPATASCAICKTGCCDECMGSLGVCTSCWYKIVAILFIVMIVGPSFSWYFW